MKSKLIVGVMGIPISKDKKILLTKRHAPGNPAWHNKWQFAGGGLNPGETVEQGVYRELNEELYVDAKIIFPYPIVYSKNDPHDDSEGGVAVQFVMLTHLVDIGSQTPDLTKDPDWETSDWGWFTKDEALRLDALQGCHEVIHQAYEIIERNAILE